MMGWDKTVGMILGRKGEGMIGIMMEGWDCVDSWQCTSNSSCTLCKCFLLLAGPACSCSVSKC
jgi:hypothetical protein